MIHIENRQTTKPVTRNKSTTKQNAKSGVPAQRNYKKRQTRPIIKEFNFEWAAAQKIDYSLATYGEDAKSLGLKTIATKKYADQIYAAVHESAHWCAAVLYGGSCKEVPIAGVAVHHKPLDGALGWCAPYDIASTEGYIYFLLFPHVIDRLVRPSDSANQNHLDFAMSQYKEFTSRLKYSPEKKPLPAFDEMLDIARRDVFFFWPWIWATAVTLLLQREEPRKYRWNGINKVDNSGRLNSSAIILAEDELKAELEYMEYTDNKHIAEIPADELLEMDVVPYTSLDIYRKDAPYFIDTMLWLHRATGKSAIQDPVLAWGGVKKLTRLKECDSFEDFSREVVRFAHGLGKEGAKNLYDIKFVSEKVLKNVVRPIIKERADGKLKDDNSFKTYLNSLLPHPKDQHEAN